jgi:hypothetical protein
MKIVINNRHGGFGLSDEARALYYKRAGTPILPDRDVKRDDPILVQVVEELGEGADDRFSELIIIEIPDDVQWQIEEYDGAEWIAERHRTWGR